MAAQPGTLLVDGLAAVLPSGGGAPQVTRVLSGADPADLPAFARVIEEADLVRILLRGAVSVVVEQRSAEVAVETTEASTWSEHVFDDVTRVVLRVGDSRPAGTPFHVTAGVVPAGLVARRPRPSVPAPRPPVFEPDPAPVAPEPPSAAEPLHYPHLVEDTRFRSIEAAAVRHDDRPNEAGHDAVEPVMPADGQYEPKQDTMVFEAGAVEAGAVEAGAVEAGAVEAGAGREDVGAFDAPRHRGVAAAADDARPTVQAVLCHRGHANQPHAANCRICGSALDDLRVRLVPRPPLGLLRLDDGTSVVIDRPLLIGRRPEANGLIDGEVPALVTIADPDRLLSRVHAEIRLAQWQVQVVDRGSMNHSYVTAPDGLVVQLPPNLPYPIVWGTRIVLGDVTGLDFGPLAE